MNYQNEQILGDNEIQSIYGQLQSNLKLISECLKHNKSMMKDFGQVTNEYGCKIEAISKKSIVDTMRVNANKIFKEMGQQLKLLGSKIIGSSQALKELMIPINEQSKTLKQSFNDYVKQIELRKRDQEEQYKKIEELKSKISSLQKSTYSNEKSSTYQLKQLKQQEKMMIEEQKMKYQQVQICKRDLGNFIVEESQIVESKVNYTETKCYEVIYLSLENFYSNFNQVALLKQLSERSFINQNRSHQRSATESRSHNYTQFSSQNQRSISPSNQIQKQESQRTNKIDNQILAPRDNQINHNQIQQYNRDDQQIDKFRNKTFSKIQFNNQFMESQDYYENLKEKSSSQIKISNNKENQNLTLSNLMNRKQSGASLKRSENSNASIFNCKGHGYLSNQESLNELFKKE